MENKNKVLETDYWDEFYRKCVIDVPSQFCVSMATDNHNKKTIVEFGMGSGRDSLYLAAQGYIVVAVDLSQSAVDVCHEKMNQQGVEHATFLCGDIADEQTIYQAIKTAREKCHDEHPELIIYSRFVMHSLDRDQESAFLTALSKFMEPGDVVYFEFRSKDDSNTEKHFGNENHFRRYVDSERFIKNLKGKYSLNVTYSITAKGMARYQEEDPVVTRIIASRI